MGIFSCAARVAGHPHNRQVVSFTTNPCSRRPTACPTPEMAAESGNGKYHRVFFVAQVHLAAIVASACKHVPRVHLASLEHTPVPSYATKSRILLQDFSIQLSITFSVSLAPVPRLATHSKMYWAQNCARGRTWLLFCRSCPFQPTF